MGMDIKEFPMTRKQEIIARAKKAIMEFDDKAAKEVAKEALAAGISPADIIHDGYTEA